MALSDLSIRNAKAGDKPRKLTDEKGLYLLVTPQGAKHWRYDYRFGGKRRTHAVGSYPKLSLVAARDMVDGIRKMIIDGIDPSEAKKAQDASDSGADSFETIAQEWFLKFSPPWALSHSDRVIRALKRDIFPWIGKRPIKEITAPEYLAVLRRVENRGAVDTAHRLRQIGSAVFRYAVATGRAERDPTGDLRGAIPPARGGHMAAITDSKETANLLRAIDGYRGGIIVRCALMLAPMIFVRPGELRHAEWTEIDLDKAEWSIPAEKMKMRQPHIVPLSRQAVSVLMEIHAVTGEGRYVFPSPRTWDRPMSENAVLAALRSLGYSKEQMCGHGFRSMASSLLNAQGWSPDVIERQLAHVDRNKVRAAYNRHDYLPERIRMMQSWADYLDILRDGAELIPFRKAE